MDGHDPKCATSRALPIGRAVCQDKVPVRFFTVSSLVMRLRRARQDNRLDKELAQIGKPGSSSSTSSATYPSTRKAAGSCSRSYPIPTRQGASSTPPTSSPADGDACSATPTWPPRSSTAPSATDGSSASRAKATAAETPSCPNGPTKTKHKQRANRKDAHPAGNPLHIPRKTT